VASGQGARFPTLSAGDYFYATLINTSNQLEIVKCTARSADVLTVERAQEGTTARAYDVGDRIEIRITAATFEDATAIYDVPTESTGYLAMPAGTTAQRPGSPVAGATRFNTESGSLEFYDGAVWISTNLIPTINSVTGTIYAGVTSTLVLDVTNATDIITVRFSEAGVTVADVANVTVSSGTYSVAVPSAVFNQTAGDTIAVSVLNQDGTPSSNAITKTVIGLPTGGTITTSSNFRIHTFTSSSSLVVPMGFSATAEYLVVAGGGGGGSDAGGGGGAGGMRTGSTTISAQTYSIVVGAGGAGGTGGSTPSDPANRAANGQNSSALGITSLGGGYGGMGQYETRGGGTGAGGSGGGGGGSFPSTGAGGPAGLGTAGQGNNGATGLPQPETGGGGGGAGQAGQSQNGGNGLASSISGTSVTYAGGGGAGGWNSSAYSDGFGGTGGGGNGGGIGTSGNKQTGVGFAGQANRGGGGGGGNQDSGGNGGSGIVIVRYRI